MNLNDVPIPLHEAIADKASELIRQFPDDSHAIHQLAVGVIKKIEERLKTAPGKSLDLDEVCALIPSLTYPESGTVILETLSDLASVHVDASRSEIRRAFDSGHATSESFNCDELFLEAMSGQADFNRAKGYLSKDDPSAALHVAGVALEKNPVSLPLLAVKILALSEMGRNAEVEEAMASAILIDPNAVGQIEMIRQSVYGRDDHIGFD